MENPLDPIRRDFGFFQTLGDEDESTWKIGDLPVKLVICRWVNQPKMRVISTETSGFSHEMTENKMDSSNNNSCMCCHQKKMVHSAKPHQKDCKVGKVAWCAHAFMDYWHWVENHQKMCVWVGICSRNQLVNGRVMREMFTVFHQGILIDWTWPAECEVFAAVLRWVNHWLMSEFYFAVLEYMSPMVFRMFQSCWSSHWIHGKTVHFPWNMGWNPAR